MQKTTKNGKSFEQWMSQVDAETLRMCGMHASDLPDVSYTDMWEDGIPPKRAARRAIRNANTNEG